MELLELLKNRQGIAEKFTKDFIEGVEKSIKLYKVEEDDRELLDKLVNINTRYDVKVPYIFSTAESMLASMFDKVPDLVFRGRGMDDKSKEDKVRASYEYLVDKLDLEQFMTSTAWYFILIGWCTAHGAFKSETREVPMFDETTGEPMIDEMGEPIMRTEYIYNDPTLDIGDPKKEFYSPESKFSNDAKQIPYYFRHELMTVEDIKKVYGKTVKPDASIKIKGMGETEGENDDIDRATVYFYYGTLPEKNKKDVKNWSSGDNFYIAYTEKEILHTDKIDEKLCRIGRWYGVPNEFFGFGIGKTLRDSQKEMSIRRGQQMRYSDLMAYPKIGYDLSVEIDDKALLDPRLGITLGFRDKPPVYLTPPPMPETLLIADDKAREDAQFISGMLDLSKGASESKVVKTATGQSIFAEAAERRIRQAKRQFGRFYREVIIMLLKLAQKHWDDQKLVTITDSKGQQMQMSISKDDLSDVDFDTDIDVDMESVTINKEVLRAQAIELYDRTKDDPLIDRKMVFKDTLRDGFDKKNPEAYMIEESELGMMPMQGQQMGQPLAQPQAGQVPSSPSGIMGANNAI